MIDKLCNHVQDIVLGFLDDDQSGCPWLLYQRERMRVLCFVLTSCALPSQNRSCACRAAWTMQIIRFRAAKNSAGLEGLNEMCGVRLVWKGGGGGGGGGGSVSLCHRGWIQMQSSAP